MSLEKSILLNVLNQEVVFEEYFCNLLKEEKFFNNSTFAHKTKLFFSVNS